MAITIPVEAKVIYEIIICLVVHDILLLLIPCFQFISSLILFTVFILLQMGWLNSSVDQKLSKESNDKSILTDIDCPACAKLKDDNELLRAEIQYLTDNLGEIMERLNKSQRGRARTPGRGHPNRPVKIERPSFTPKPLETPERLDLEDMQSGLSTTKYSETEIKLAAKEAHDIIKSGEAIRMFQPHDLTFAAVVFLHAFSLYHTPPPTRAFDKYMIARNMFSDTYLWEKFLGILMLEITKYNARNLDVKPRFRIFSASTYQKFFLIIAKCVFNKSLDKTEQTKAPIFMEGALFLKDPDLYERYLYWEMAFQPYRENFQNTGQDEQNPNENGDE